VPRLLKKLDTARRNIHCLVKYNEKQYSNRKGDHINGLEEFWGDLKRKQVSKIVSNDTKSLPFRGVDVEIQSKK